MNLVWQALSDAARLWAGAIELHPDPGARLSLHWAPALIVAAAALLAGYLGQAVVLVINRLRGRALAFSLVVSFVWLLIVAAVAAGLLALGARFVLGDRNASLEVLARLVLTSFAPLVFSFTTIIPLLGPMLERLLQAWMLAIVWVNCHALWPASGWRVALLLLVVAAALLALHTLTSRWVGRARDRLYHRVTGTHLHPSTAYLLELVGS